MDGRELVLSICTVHSLYRFHSIRTVKKDLHVLAKVNVIR